MAALRLDDTLGIPSVGYRNRLMQSDQPDQEIRSTSQDHLTTRFKVCSCITPFSCGLYRARITRT